MGVSTMSTLSFKEVRETCPNALLLMQMYLFKRDDLTLMLLKLCEDAGYNPVAVTVDSPISGMRREDNRYGFNPLMTEAYIIQKQIQIFLSSDFLVDTCY